MASTLRLARIGSTEMPFDKDMGLDLGAPPAHTTAGLADVLRPDQMASLHRIVSIPLREKPFDMDSHVSAGYSSRPRDCRPV